MSQSEFPIGSDEDDQECPCRTPGRLRLNSD
jgi:hypothetical protein